MCKFCSMDIMDFEIFREPELIDAGVFGKWEFALSLDWDHRTMEADLTRNDHLSTNASEDFRLPLSKVPIKFCPFCGKNIENDIIRYAWESVTCRAALEVDELYESWAATVSSTMTSDELEESASKFLNDYALDLEEAKSAKES